MLQNASFDIIEVIFKNLSMKQISIMRCVAKAFDKFWENEYAHTFHVLKHGNRIEPLKNLQIDRVFYNMDIELQARLLRNQRISCGLKSKLKFYIHKKEYEKYKYIISENEVTHEQQNVMDVSVKSNRVLLIQAYAGTGKTRTLVEYAKCNPNATILYLAYNKELCEDAQRRFVGMTNVKVSTIHSIAYKYFEESEVGELRMVDVMKQYKVTPVEALQMLREFSRYCHKTIEHTEHTKWIWDDMFVDTKFMLTHDAYLKQYQLTKPELNYDVIMLDEVQDCNDCILDIVNRQNVMKIYVGDIYQKLYGFRNVEDPFTYLVKNKRECDDIVRKRLSISFRIGFDLMYHVNIFLNNKFKVKGFSNSINNDTKILPNNNNEMFDSNEPIVYLCRFNINVMKLCVKFVLQDKMVYIYGKTFDFDKEIEVTTDFINVTLGNYDDVQNKECMSTSIDELIKTYNEMFMSVWRQRIMLFIEYGSELLNYWEKMKMNVTKEKERAQIILSTVHQSKGSEFDNVCLHDDLSINSQDSLYVMYVAMTRAKKRLKLNKVMDSYFLKNKGCIYYKNTQILNQNKLCVTCDTRTNNNVWMDVDYTSQFNDEDSEIFENKNMCHKCQVKVGVI